MGAAVVDRRLLWCVQGVMRVLDSTTSGESSYRIIVRFEVDPPPHRLALHHITTTPLIPARYILRVNE